MRNHLLHFVQHIDELRVCALELDSLSGEYYDEVAEVRRDYYKLMVQQVQQLRGSDPQDSQTRLATLSLFGSLNWLFQWYDPAKGPDPEALRKGKEFHPEVKKAARIWPHHNNTGGFFLAKVRK